MGQIANDMIDGVTCSWCGMFFSKKHGYPVACKSCWADVLEESKTDEEYIVEKDKHGKIYMISGIQRAIENTL